MLEKLVTDVRAINENVNEIHFNGCAFQVYSPLFNVKSDETISINVSAQKIQKGDYGMSGTVYSVVDNKMLISCGGLIGVLEENKDFPPGSFIHLMFTKRKKRKTKS